MSKAVDVNAWLLSNNIDPKSVSDDLKALLSLCDDPSYAELLRVLITVTEMPNERFY